MPAVRPAAAAAASESTTSSGATARKMSSSERCSNPFRVPRHVVVTGLRNVPQEVRDRLAHVNFGRRICHTCRMRVYKMIKERRQCKPSPRLVVDAQQQHQQQQVAASRRRSEPLVQQATASGGGRDTSNVKPPTPPSSAAVPVVGGVQASSADHESPPTMNGNVSEEPIVPSLSSNPAPPSRTRNSLPNLTANINTFPEHTMSRRNKSQISPPLFKDGKKVCCFCGLSDDNEVEFGKFYEHSGIVTHYYCLLLSSNMEQKGSDDQGILGFLVDDIQREIRRGKRLPCSHCKKSGATLGCCNVKCKRIFHLPCGLKAGSLHQFFGEFRSYCINHRPTQKIDERVKNEVKNMVNLLCYICYEDVEPFDTNKTLWAPCCKKNAWFHRQCVQQLAMSAGYFFKCPLCNNKREFQTAMLEYGIYIPRQDASWELVPNAFEELLYRHDRCDAQPCLCPKGRTYSANSARWELILCRLCGSQGIHVFCGQLKLANPTWECQECMAITKKSSTAGATPNDSTTSSNNSTIQRGNVTLNITATENDDDSDSDISVGNDSPIVDSLDNISATLPPIKLRPGPKSFKLQQVQQIKNNGIDKQGITTSHDPAESASNASKNIRFTAIPAKMSEDVICIDSDDEMPEFLCESGIRNVKRNPMNRFKYAPNASSSSSSSLSNSMPFIAKNMAYDTTPIDLGSPVRSTTPTLIEATEDTTCNFIITNVTSVPAEFFASVPDSPTKETITELPIITTATPDVPNHLKRNHQEVCDEEHDSQEIAETLKRARLDSGVDLESTKVEEKLVPPSNVPSLPESSTEAVAPPTTEESNCASAVPKNCHEDAGTGPADAPCKEPDDDSAADARAVLDHADDSRPAHSEPAVNTSDCHELAVSTANNSVSANGPSFSSNDNGDNVGSPESRSSSSDQSGLIPDFVRLSDLKFKISGNELELAYRACKIQMKMTDMQHITSSSSDTYNAASVSSAGSNQNITSEKSSKSFPPRSDDSDESSRILRSRSRGPRSFVYEDDNTLLEYPTTQVHSNAGISKESLLREKGSAQRNHNDLKENWDPEVSDSPMSNQFVSAPKDKIVNPPEKSSKSENDSASTPKDDSSVTPRSLRSKSSRLVRHFHSVQNAHSPINGLIIEESPKPKPDKYFPIFEKRSPRSATRSQNNSNAVEEDKHLKNVNMNDLRFKLTGTVKDMRDCQTHDIDVFKVSIDLQKIKTLITDKPDLFFKTNSDEYGSMCVYKMGQKLQIELKSGEKKILTKSRSYECLVDLAKNSLRFESMKKCKSLDNLLDASLDDSVILPDKKDWEEKKVKSQRRKTRQFDKNECVR